MNWLWISAVVIVIDQATKHLAVDRLVEHQPIPVLPFLNMTLTFNPGAAFSFLGSASGWQRWLFSGIAVAVSVFILSWLRRLPRGLIWVPSALALILGGALGNLWDRLALGHVVDFIDVYYDRWHWPAFNVADSAICVGVAMLLLSAFRDDEES